MVCASLSNCMLSFRHLQFRGSSIMKLTTDRFSLGHIILAVGALSFLPSSQADFAKCVAGWEWVRSYQFLVCRGLLV